MENRRKTDSDLMKILGKIESHIEQQKDLHEQCFKERETLFSRTNVLAGKVGILETKQKLVSWIGGMIAVSWVGAMFHTFSRWIGNHLKCILIFFLLLSVPIQASECPVKSKDVQEIVEVFNNYSVSRNYGLLFECKNPEAAKPVLECYTPLTTEQCLELREQIKELAKGMSIDWNIYTNNKEVNVYDDSNKLIYFIDRDGRFYCIFDNTI